MELGCSVTPSTATSFLSPLPPPNLSLEAERMCLISLGELPRLTGQYCLSKKVVVAMATWVKFHFCVLFNFNVYLIVKYFNISHKINAIDTAFQVVAVGLKP